MVQRFLRPRRSHSPLKVPKVDPTTELCTVLEPVSPRLESCVGLLGQRDKLSETDAMEQDSYGVDHTDGVLPALSPNAKPRRKPPWHLIPLGLLVAVIALATFFVSRARERGNDVPRGAENYSTGLGVQIHDVGNRGHGNEYLYEMPSGSPRGVMLLLHGCAHTALGFWYRSNACHECIGLDAGVRWKNEALARGYIALAVSSFNTKSKCWMGLEDGLAGGRGRDFDNVKEALDAVVDAVAASGDSDGAKRARERVIAYGISSGGKFVSALPIAKNGAGKGVIAIVSNVTPAIKEAIAERGAQYPPIAFIHMSRNARDMKKITANLSALKRAGVPGREWIVEPRAFTGEFCARKLPKLGRENCDEFVGKLREGGFLNPEDFIKKPPRRSGWQEIAGPTAALIGDNLQDFDASPLAAAMNVAWAFHEMTSEFMGDALDWLEPLVE